ncbi:MAG: hypothetical protein RLZZ444_4645 [Pseudomonadota bacterium]|jgi:uncharacterized protein YciI
MYLVQLVFSDEAGRAADLMDGHNQWLRQGFADGAFLMAGSLQDRKGGAILAQAANRQEIETRLASDPFVAEGVVKTEIIAFRPGKADPRLEFLLAGA